MTTFIPPTTNDALSRLLAKVAKLPPMTPEQKRAQRRSWVRGEMMLEHPEMTADYVNKMMDELGI